jgi:hypothetical protein
MNIEHWLPRLFPNANCQLIIDYFALIFKVYPLG